MTELTYLNAEELRAALPMLYAVTAMRDAFVDDREAPPRVALGVSLFMPGRVGQHTAVKVVSSVPGNPAGLVAVFGPDGSPLGIVDGPTLTAIRTGAAAGLATELLARRDARTMAMLGAGAMAPDQVAAVQAVRPIEHVLVWSRTRQRADALAEKIRSSSGTAPAVNVVDSPDEAISMANIISCATPATTPLFDATAVRPGTHINAIGAFRPEMAELPAALLHDSWVVVDDLQAAALEAGDLLQADREPDGEMSDLLAGRVAPLPGMTTVYKSCGAAGMDVASALAALQNAPT